MIFKFRNEHLTATALHNHNRIVFEEMSSWTASTWHAENTYLKKYSTLQERAHKVGL